MAKEKLIDVALTSPALRQKSDEVGTFAYPKDWDNKVPLKVKMIKTVEPDYPFLASIMGTVAYKNKKYYVWVNSYGAVSAILPNGEQLGLKPNEFIVTDWHKQ